MGKGAVIEDRKKIAMLGQEALPELIIPPPLLASRQAGSGNLIIKEANTLGVLTFVIFNDEI